MNLSKLAVIYSHSCIIQLPLKAEGFPTKADMSLQSYRLTVVECQTCGLVLLLTSLWGLCASLRVTLCLDSVQHIYSPQGKEEYPHQHHIPILISSIISNKDWHGLMCSHELFIQMVILFTYILSFTLHAEPTRTPQTDWSTTRFTVEAYSWYTITKLKRICIGEHCYQSTEMNVSKQGQ